MEDQKKEFEELNVDSEAKEENASEEAKVESTEDANVAEDKKDKTSLEEKEEVAEEPKTEETKEEVVEEVKPEEVKEEIKKEEAPKEEAKPIKEKKPAPKKQNKPKKKKAQPQVKRDEFKIEESEEKKARRKKFTIAELIVIGIVIIAVIAVIAAGSAAPDTDFGKWVKDIWDVNNVFKDFAGRAQNLVKYLFYVAIILAVCTLVRIIFKHKMKKSDRAKTVITLLDGLVKYGCAIAVIVFTLQALGVNAMAIFASIGILTLVIGLGCQSLIADVVAGMFIIFENEYNVGEIIVVGDFRGTVIEIGIRATKILDYAGNIKIINNSDVSNVINMSRELSLAVVDCEFPYDVPIEVVEKLLKDNFDDFREKIPAIIDGPFYKGVSGYGDSNVAVMVVAKCKEDDRYQVQRDLLRAYRKVFTEAGIDLSFNQVVVNQAKPTEYKVTKKMKDDAQEFIDEQKELSKNMESNENQ